MAPKDKKTRTATGWATVFRWASDSLWAGMDMCRYEMAGHVLFGGYFGGFIRVYHTKKDAKESLKAQIFAKQQYIRWNPKSHTEGQFIAIVPVTFDISDIMFAREPERVEVRKAVMTEEPTVIWSSAKEQEKK